MRRQLAVADSKGMPAYLESSKENNIPIYQSFGFKVTGEIKLPEGPTLYPMWRPACQTLHRFLRAAAARFAGRRSRRRFRRFA
jgi:hypothetical protein